MLPISENKSEDKYLVNKSPKSILNVTKSPPPTASRSISIKSEKRPIPIKPSSKVAPINIEESNKTNSTSIFVKAADPSPANHRGSGIHKNNSSEMVLPTPTNKNHANNTEAQLLVLQSKQNYTPKRNDFGKTASDADGKERPSNKKHNNFSNHTSPEVSPRRDHSPKPKKKVTLSPIPANHQSNFSNLNKTALPAMDETDELDNEFDNETDDFEISISELKFELNTHSKHVIIGLVGVSNSISAILMLFKPDGNFVFY